MIRIAITAAACHAIGSTLPVDPHLWLVHYRDGQCLIHTGAAVLDPRVGSAQDRRELLIETGDAAHHVAPSAMRRSSALCDSTFLEEVTPSGRTSVAITFIAPRRCHRPPRTSPMSDQEQYVDGQRRPLGGLEMIRDPGHHFFPDIALRSS